MIKKLYSEAQKCVIESDQNLKFISIRQHQEREQPTGKKKKNICRTIRTPPTVLEKLKKKYIK